MTLILKVISYKGLPPADAMSAQFDEQGGSIGRAPDNHLVLPDAEKYVSRLHARVVFQNSQYFIQDNSTGGTYLALKDQLLQQNRALLQNGEKLRIGEYELEVGISGNASAAVIAKPVRQLELAESGILETPFATAEKPEQPADFFSSFIEQPESSPFHQSFTPPKVADIPSSTGVDDLDFGDLLSSLDSLPGDSSGSKQQPELPPLPDDFFAEEPDSGESSAPQPLPAISEAEKSTDTLNPVFPDASPLAGSNPFEFGHEDEASQPVATNPFDALPSASNQFTSPGAISAPAAPVHGSKNPSLPDFKEPAFAPPKVHELQAKQPTAEVADSELLRQFLAGAGITDAQFLRSEQLPMMMRTSGELLRGMVEGLMRVLRARAELKSQFRLSVTTMRSVDNNPLKFTPNVDDAIKLLLAPTNPGFLGPKESVREGFNDIMNHQMAMTAGIQAALAEILHSFDPELIEKSHSEGVLFQKKAKCWEHYVGNYPQLKAAAREEFFGDAFAEAYEQQMLMLNRPAKP